MLRLGNTGCVCDDELVAGVWQEASSTSSAPQAAARGRDRLNIVVIGGLS